MKKYTLEFSGEEINIIQKCIKAAFGLEPLSENYKQPASKLYDRINKEWHNEIGVV